MTSYQEAAQRRDPIGVLRQAVLFASLWAIGSSWAVAIHEIVTTIVPDDNGSVVLAELGAATVTTLIAMGATFVATMRCDSTSSAASSSEAVAVARTRQCVAKRPPSRLPRS